LAPLWLRAVADGSRSCLPSAPSVPTPVTLPDRLGQGAPGDRRQPGVPGPAPSPLTCRKPPSRRLARRFAERRGA